MAFPWVKNTKGEPSASLTMSVVAFLSVTLWLLTWLIATPFGAPVPPFDAATAMSYLSPILALYFGRRYTADVSDKKINMSLGEETLKNKEPDVK